MKLHECSYQKTKDKINNEFFYLVEIIFNLTNHFKLSLRNRLSKRRIKKVEKLFIIFLFSLSFFFAFDY
jgi:hypothetical protein